MNDEPHTFRPSSVAPDGNQPSQKYDFAAREKAVIPEALEDWRDKLLASGPNRGVSFQVEFRSKLVIRAFLGGAYARGKTLIFVLRCPLRDSDDLKAVEKLLDHYFRTWDAAQ